MACKHTELLCLTNQDTSTTVTQTGRFRSLVNSLQSPRSQYPSLIFFIESQSRRILTASQPCTSASPGRIHLSLEPDTVSEEYPTLVASAFSISSTRRSMLRRKSKCCSVINQQLLDMPAARSESLIFSRIWFPFVDVFCFVYHSDSDLENIINKMLSLVETQKKSSFDYIMPEIIIVITREETKASKNLLTRLESCLEKPIFDYFSALRFEKIQKDALMTPRGRSQLNHQLLKATARTRRKKMDRGVLFSADHLGALFEIAFNGLTSTEPFDFIKASRINNPIADTLLEHLTDFIDQLAGTQDWTSFATETIASSLLLDHYLPEMHGKL